MSEKTNYANTKRALIILLCAAVLSFILKIVANSIKQNGDDKVKVTWTSEAIKNMHANLYNGLGDTFTDSDRNKIADCILGKVKNKYPSGFDGLDKDSLAKETEILGEDCIKGMVLHFRWSKLLVDKLKQRANASDWIKSVKQKDKDKFCNCYIDHLKQMYPNGIVGRLSQSEIDSAVTYCKNKFNK